MKDGVLGKIRSVAVYCGSRTPTDPSYDDAARELSRILIKNGITISARASRRGSGIGTMKVLADAMLEAGGNVTGVFTQSLEDEYLHEGLTETVIVSSLAERKAEMIERGDVIVALPGGFGTLDELFDAVAHRKMRKGGHRKPIGMLNLNGYYDALLAFLAHAREVGYIAKEDACLIKSAPSPLELLKLLASH